MLSIIRRLVHFTSSQRGAKITVLAWIGVVILLSFLAPSAKDYETNGTEGSVTNDKPSEIAAQVLEEEFPSDDGLTALGVFYRESGLTSDDKAFITEFSEWLDSSEAPDTISSTLPYHELPENVQDSMYSDDESTLVFNFSLEEDLDSSDTHETITTIQEKVDSFNNDDWQFEVTGPAGIASDTTALFKNADFVLMISTIALIFVLLIIIYRSPLLALTPLVIAAVVYGLVDRVIGLVGKYDIFVIEGQAVSIMLVLMFAVITDYSLFIFSRYREKLRKHASKYESMSEAMYHVSEPIFFSGGTVLLAMLTLFVTVFEPYNHFAPVFSIAVVFILLAGLTLIPALFSLMGRRAFWPFIPKVEEDAKEKKGFWHKVSHVVVKRPKTITVTLLVIFIAGALNTTTINFSFNLLKSFPDDASSRQGFEILEENYPAGMLAPVDLVLTTDHEIDVDEQFLQQTQDLLETIEQNDAVESIRPEVTEEMINETDDLPNGFLSESGKAVNVQITLASNPHEQEAIQALEQMREESGDLLQENGFNKDRYTLHFSGQTAEQLDVKQMNVRDMVLLISVVTILLTIALGWQTKSVTLPLLMMGTILLSYVASLGFGWWIIEHLFGYDSMSYRLPVYTFVFMVALGIDYNIMLVSRIRENVTNGMTWAEAIQLGIAKTGGVISSAGLILAATFSVLMTQPLQELFLFGFIMGIGILLDTFIVRGFLLPSILAWIHKRPE
ncbi:MAG TPA: MMPL family transporter [Bacillota bacterium]|nr:MMPL family transporter [Bacillota bacterium]